MISWKQKALGFFFFVSTIYYTVLYRSPWRHWGYDWGMRIFLWFRIAQGGVGLWLCVGTINFCDIKLLSHQPLLPMIVEKKRQKTSKLESKPKRHKKVTEAPDSFSKPTKRSRPVTHSFEESDSEERSSGEWDDVPDGGHSSVNNDLLDENRMDVDESATQKRQAQKEPNGVRICILFEYSIMNASSCQRISQSTEDFAWTTKGGQA